MKKVVMALMLFGMFAIDVSAQVTIPAGNPVGTGSNSTLTRKPYGAFFGFERTALIYLQSELGAAGNISTIAFYLETVSSPANVPVNIYMKHTAAATFAATSTVATELTGATLVYSGTLSSWTAGSWITTTLTTPFSYNGTSNLEIIIEQNFGGGGGEGSTAKAFRYTNQGTGVNRAQYWQADTNPPTGNGTLFIYRPNIQLTIAPPPPCAGTPSISGANAAVSSFDCSGTPSLNLSTYPMGVTGINYQWQSSPAGQNSWTNVGGTLSTPAYTAPTITASTDYRVQATCTSLGGGTATSNTVAVTVNTPVTSPSTSTICATNDQALTVTIPVGGAPTTIFSENFNSGTGAFTFVNTTTGGTNPAGAAWTLRPSGYVYSSETHIPPTATQFIQTNSDIPGSGTTVHTEMISPVINTNGLTTLSLNYNHYFRFLSTSAATVQVTTNGTTWTTVATYTGANAGSPSAWAAASINLNAYINQSNFQFRFVFNAGWHWYWSVDDVTLSGIPQQTVVWSATGGAGNGLPAGALVPSVANNNITVTPTTAGTYTYTATTSACGSAPAVTIIVDPAPVAAFTVTADSVCENTPVTVNFTGTPNAVIYFHDATNNYTVLTDGLGNSMPWNSAPLTVGTHIYTLDSVQGTSCTVDASGTLTVEATPRPTAILTSVSPSPICDGGVSTVSVAAINSYTWPATVYLDNGVTITSHTTSNNSDNFNVSPTTGTYTYTIDHVMDAQGCASIPGGTSGSGTLTVNPRPTATISASAPSVCSGDLVTYTVTLTGTGPWDFEYTDGTTPVQITGYATNTYTFTTNPTANETFSFNSLSDNSGCGSLPVDYSSTATVTIGSPATVTDPASTSATCTGSSASFSVTSTGLNVAYAWLENGVLVTNGVNYSGANSNTLVINNTAGMNGYTYQAIAIGQCGIPDTSNAATLNVTTTNNWSGTVSTSWNDGMNWSCGTVPVVTTDVIIPSLAPFMPIIDAPGGIANSVSIAAGGSLVFDFGQELEIKANIANAGTFDASSGKLTLSGNGPQNIPGGMYLDMEVAGPGLKTLDADAMVDNMLTLTNGMIELNNFNLTLGAPELTAGGSVLSYILTNGTGEVIGINIDGVDSVTFHVGATTTTYNPLGLSNAGTVDNFGVRALDNVYVDGTGTNPAQVTFPVIDNTWIVTEGTAGGSMVRLKPYYDISQALNGFDNNWVFGVYHDGTMWEALIDSADLGTLALGFTQYYTVLDSIQAFGSFAVGSGTQFPLSVTVTDITAANFGTRNKVDWKSATEAVGDKYELQHSADGKSFATIATLNAKGEASTYTYWHADPVTGANYYRVKLVDANGKFGYTKVVSATVKGSNFSIEAYPNPVSNVVTVKVNGVMGANASVEITDATGKVVRTATFEGSKLDINLADVAAGIYFIKYSDDNNHESIKINKQ